MKMGSRLSVGLRRALAAWAVAGAVAVFAAGPAVAADDAYRPPEDNGYSSGDSYQAPPSSAETYEPYTPGGARAVPPYRNDAYRANPDGGDSYQPADGGGRGGDYPSDPGGYGAPYSGGGGDSARGERYEPVPDEPPPGDRPGGSRGYYTQNEVMRVGHKFFGSVSTGLAEAIEWAFRKSGRPNGYILGQDAGGALVAGLRYGEGRLYTKDAGEHKVYWQGPTVGYDFGAEGSKVMVLVYNLHDPAEIYTRFGGVQGAAYVVGGVGVQLQTAGHVTLAPIRAGVGLRLGANLGYLKYTRKPTWNPF